MYYYQIPATAPARLAKYRAEAQKAADAVKGKDCQRCASMRQTAGQDARCYYCAKAARCDWRDYRKPVFRKGSQWQYTDENGRRVYGVEGEPVGWPSVDYADEIIRLRYKGWFADNWQDSTYRGVVYQLPARRGRPVYVPGYYDACANATLIYYTDSSDTKEQAARDADWYAEKCAEQSREGDARQHAETLREELADDIRKTRRELLSIMREARPLRKSMAGAPALCAALREKIRDGIADIKRMRDRREALEENYWLAVEGD